MPSACRVVIAVALVCLLPLLASGQQGSGRPYTGGTPVPVDGLPTPSGRSLDLPPLPGASNVSAPYGVEPTGDHPSGGARPAEGPQAPPSLRPAGVSGRSGLSSGEAIPAPGPRVGVNVGPQPPAPPYTNYLGSHTPSVTVDWVTPESIMLGREGLYELVLRNPGQVAIENLVIEQVLPRGFRLVEASPPPDQHGQEPVWRVAQLDPHEELRIGLRLVPMQGGEARSEARVTFSTYSLASFRVVEPILQIAVEGPDTALVGNQAVFTVTVSNPGTGPANNAVLHVQLPEGMAHVAESSTYDLGVLNPDETRSVQVLADVVSLGDHNCQFIASADDGLHDEAEKQVRAIGAQLALEIDGPTFRYVTRPAAYTLRIRNTGRAAAQNLRLRTAVPATFAFEEADHGGRFDAASNTINWFLGHLEPEQEIEIACQLRAMDAGDFPILAQAVAERGLLTEAEHLTRVEGIAAILLEVVDVDDPVEVGADTFYEVIVTNQGTDFATNIEVMAEAPEGITILGGTGPSEPQMEGRTIRFAPLPQLAPRADAIYRVTVRGAAEGDFRMRVQAIADTLEEPVVELESTKVYQD